MGAGAAGYAQYLFSDDVPGQNRGRVPRQARVSADFAAEYDRLQALRVEAMGRFARDVHLGDYPAPHHLVDCDHAVVGVFHDWPDQVACDRGARHPGPMPSRGKAEASPAPPLARCPAQARHGGLPTPRFPPAFMGEGEGGGLRARTLKPLRRSVPRDVRHRARRPR